MKTRLPKMLLAAVLAAMTSAYASVYTENGHQYYYGEETITNPSTFGSEPLTVNIGYSDGIQAYDARVFLNGPETFTTPNALFIGGPGWPHHISEGYQASKGWLEMNDGAILVVGTEDSPHITMGSCTGAFSSLFVTGGSEIWTGSMEVSNGGGQAYVMVGEEIGGVAGPSGYIHLDGDLMVGVNKVEGSSTDGRGSVYVNSGAIDVLGATSIGYESANYPGGDGIVVIGTGGVLNTASLEVGVGQMYDGVKGAIGELWISGRLNVTSDAEEVLIGVAGGTAMVEVNEGGIANLGSADVRIGSKTIVPFSPKEDGMVWVKENASLIHNGNIYVGDFGTVSLEGDDNYGHGALWIEGKADLKNVEVSSGSFVYVGGDVSVNETPWGKVNAPGIHLYNGSLVGGAPTGKKLTLVSVKESGDTQVDIRMGAEGLTLTKGTTFESCCDTHLKVSGGSTLTFGEGTLWLTEGIGYIDGEGGYAGTINTTSGTGHVSVEGNGSINGLLDLLTKGDGQAVALIDTADFNASNGNRDAFLGGMPESKLVLNRAGYSVLFTNDALTDLTLLNADQDGFRGFYVVKTAYPAEEAYPTFDRNQREVYDHIKRLDEEGTPMPDELKEVITDVLNTDGITDGGKLRETLDFLGAVNYSVMMHNQIEGNLSHQRMLRNRSMVGRNLRHGKGCTDLYAAGFYDNQRLKYSRSQGEGYRRSEWGGMIGGDTCLNENWRLGADVALGWSNISPTHNMKLKQRSVYWDVYAQYRKGNWRSLTAVGMGIHNFKVERGIHNSILDLTAKKNSVRGLSLNISEEITYDWKVNDKTTIQPFAAVDMSWNRISSFTDGEIGALNMHVGKQTAFIAEFTVGGRYIRDFACVTDAPDATWYFQLGVAVAAGDVDSDMDCNFQGTPDKHFTIKAADRDRVGLDLGTGLTIPVNANWAIYGNAEIILRGDSHHLNAQIGAQYAF